MRDDRYRTAYRAVDAPWDGERERLVFERLTERRSREPAGGTRVLGAALLGTVIVCLGFVVHLPRGEQVSAGMLPEAGSALSHRSALTTDLDGGRREDGEAAD